MEQGTANVWRLVRTGHGKGVEIPRALLVELINVYGIGIMVYRSVDGGFYTASSSIFEANG